MRTIFPQATRDAADLLKKLLVFDPEKRLTASEALRHPYVANFHDPANEPRCSRPVTIPINDNEKVWQTSACIDMIEIVKSPGACVTAMLIATSVSFLYTRACLICCSSCVSDLLLFVSNLRMVHSLVAQVLVDSGPAATVMRTSVMRTRFCTKNTIM